MSSPIINDVESERALPAAGWYPDPTGAGQLRWWGGLAWTEHVKSADQATR